MPTSDRSGASTRTSPYALVTPTSPHPGAYTTPHLRFNGYVVYPNRVPTTAMRGFGVTSVSFAVEMHMNRIAQVLGIDPFEVRLKNANRIGDTTANWVALKDPSTVPVMQAAAERIGVQLRPEYQAMTNERRSGDMLPEHLVGQLGTNGGGQE